MTIPSIADITLPLLRLAASQEVSFGESVERLGKEFGLTEDEISEMLPSGLQARFANRVRWAKVELGMAGLVQNTKPKHFSITDRGLAVLKTPPLRLDYKYLMQIDQYREKVESYRQKSQQKNRSSESDRQEPVQSDLGPDEQIDAAHQELTTALAEELLDQITSDSPMKFEKLVVKLMLAMGYGGSRDDAGHHLGRSGDGGIDGTIDEDPLGLGVVYLQAKRYQRGSSVGRPEVQAFVGSLVGHGANKGVFVTTASFSQHAREYAHTVPQSVILIDGEELTRLMIKYEVGVRKIRSIEIKKIDEEFFSSYLS